MTKAVGEFYLADDDEVAVKVGPGKRHEFPAVPCDGIYPDDAALRWQVLLTGSSGEDSVATGRLRDVVPMANDGFTVFAVPDELRTALAVAGGERLRTTAVAWAETCYPDYEISPDAAVGLLERLAVLAARGVEHELSLYCWYFAP
ncbi:hypothetical protein [Streptomyces niveus]|uniref:hypothetical protein n=1 Tax=Streptomyces niveus TaxID=193462 RepID=UPI0013313F33|nr:hypothetical protein [Streptomyces niveus]